MTTVHTEQFALPRPESWREDDAWRVAFTLLTDHEGNQFFSVNASTHSAMTGTELEQLPVENPRAALWVDYKGKGYTFHWRFDLDGPEENRLRGNTTNGRAQRRASSKVYDYAPPTYHDAIYLAVFSEVDKLCRSEWFKLILDRQKQQARTLHIEVLDAAVEAAQAALAAAKRERTAYIFTDDGGAKYVQGSLFPDLVPDKEL